MKMTGRPERWFKLALPSRAHIVFKLSFVLTLSASLLILLAVNAFSQPPPCDATGDYPFRVTNDALIDNGRFDFCIQCSGPWLRASMLTFIKFTDLNCEFYAADKGLFDPKGKWTCNIWLAGGHNQQGLCEIASDIIDSKDFCLGNSGSDLFVDIHIVPDEAGTNAILETNQPSPPCSPSVSSFLGDNFKQEKSNPDNDTFNFTGLLGDEVKLQLESDTQAGNNGGIAGLSIRGDSLNESKSGVLPLEIDVTLPADGEYSISVHQPKNSDERFRGSYILRVGSPTGSMDSIEPSSNVEK